MHLTFVGHRLTPKQKHLISEAASAALDILVSHRMKNSLDITIEITKNMYKQTGSLGNCGLEDESQSPKFFTVELNYSGVESFGMLITALCHELVHVAQYAQRRLRDLTGLSRMAWKNKHYNTNVTSYYDRPWEIEAHQLEEDIYNKVSEEKNLRKYLNMHNCDEYRVLVVN